MNQVIMAEEAGPLGGAERRVENPSYIIAARGFSRLFWGVALTAVLFFSQVQMEFFSGARLPAYFIGTVFQFWGLMTLRRAGRMSARWSFCIVLAVMLTLAEIYFFPFVYWWRLMPHIIFYTVNVGILAASVILVLYLINIIAADFFGHLALRGERLEARIYAGAVVAFMGVPFILGVVFAGMSSLRYDALFIDELADAVTRIPVWFYFIVTIPCSLTMAVLWKARDRGYQRYCREKGNIKEPGLQE